MVVGLVSVILATSGILAGCSNTSAPSDTAQPKATDKPADKPVDKPAETSKEPVTLKWATWAGEEDANRTIKAFEATHPNIKIEQEKSVTWPWNEKLAAAVAAGNTPDVTWTFGVPTAVANGWLEDLTPYLSADAEYKQGKTFKNLDDTAKYDGKQYALPHSLYMFALFVNTDLFAKENVPVPTAKWTVDELRKDAQALTKFNDHQFGVKTVNQMRETLPSAFDPSLGWNTWDGKKYNLTNPAFKTDVDYINQIMKSDKSAAESYSQDERTQWYGKDKDPWILGKIGMVYDGTWALGGNAKNAKFKWDVLPVPADKGQKIPLITDYVGISKSSKHKKEAFEFLKWLTFSKEGWMTRMGQDWPLGTTPLINDQEVWDAYLKRPEMPAGMKEIIKMIPNGIVDPIKWLPGYEAALNIYNDGFKQVDEGKAKFEDIAPDLEKRMNDTYTEAVNKMKEAAK